MRSFGAIAAHSVLPPAILDPVIECTQLRMPRFKGLESLAVPLTFAVFSWYVFAEYGVAHLVIQQRVQPDMKLRVIKFSCDNYSFFFRVAGCQCALLSASAPVNYIFVDVAAFGEEFLPNLQPKI